MPKFREVKIWENDDPEWTENGEKEHIAAVHIDHDNGYHSIYISCRTNWGWVDDPHEGIYGLKWDFPERFSEECRGAATVAFRALQEFNMLKYKLFDKSPFVIIPEQEEQDRYGNLLGLFYPEYRNDVWVNYMETEDALR